MKTVCNGSVLAQKDGRKIISCKSCGYDHVVPMYTTKELENYYENIYAESTPSYLWREKLYNIKKIMPVGSILDVGCWEGIQLEYFLKDGWKCTGIELNKRASQVAKNKGIEVHQLSIGNFFTKFSGRKWDVINVAYILEHIIDPLSFLVSLKKHLNRGGILIIEVPNEFSPLQLAYIKEHGLEPYWIALPDHPNYFNKQKLNRLLHKAGWRVIHGEASFPMELFLLMGDNYLQDKKLGKRCFSKVVQAENILREYDCALLPKIYSALYKSGIGRSITVYASLRRSG